MTSLVFGKSGFSLREKAFEVGMFMFCWPHDLAPSCRPLNPLMLVGGRGMTFGFNNETARLFFFGLVIVLTLLLCFEASWLYNCTYCVFSLYGTDRRIR